MTSSKDPDDTSSLLSFFSTLLSVVHSHDARSRTLLFVACSLFTLMVMELAAGIMQGSLGLLADALHLLFHALGVSVTLWGALNARRGITSAFTYGFARYEVLATFSNATLLIFMQLFLLSGIVHHLIEPANFSGDKSSSALGLKLLFGGAGIALNVWAVLALGGKAAAIGADAVARFRGGSGALSSGGSNSSGSSSSSSGGGGGSARQQQPRGSSDSAAMAPLLSDALSSVFLVISAFAAPHIGVVTADVLQAVGSAAITLSVVIPLAAVSADCLLQAVPAAASAALDRARRDVLSVEGVLEVTSEHYWLQSPGHGVCTVALRVRNEASEAAVLSSARKAYAHVAADLTIQIEKDPKIETWAELAAGMGLTATHAARPIVTVAVDSELAPSSFATSAAVQRPGHSAASHGHSHASGSGAHGHSHAREDSRSE
jgi:cation diffusion facilitator family transporter